MPGTYTHVTVYLFCIFIFVLLLALWLLPAAAAKCLPKIYIPMYICMCVGKSIKLMSRNLTNCQNGLGKSNGKCTRYVQLPRSSFVFSIFLALHWRRRRRQIVCHTLFFRLLQPNCARSFISLFVFCQRQTALNLGAQLKVEPPQLGRHTFSTRPPTCRKMSATAPELATGKCDTTFCCYYIRI